MRKLQLSMVIGMLFCMILLAGCNNELKTSNSDKDMTQYESPDFIKVLE